MLTQEMTAYLLLIWDFDTAIGQVNATYPYSFHETVLLDELSNVDRILDLAGELGIRMTFACVGFAAEEGHFPYHVPSRIARIHELGHEVASHSWKHEWFPYLEREQIRRSLARSKSALEACVGKPGAVTGFVPPFSRPMSWYGKAAFSLGDRVFGPWYAGASIGSLLKVVDEVGYRWCRVVYRPIWKKITGDLQRRPFDGHLPTKHRVCCIPNTYCGFDEPALALLQAAIEQDKAVVISGHPSGLSRNGEESFQHFSFFMRRVAEYQKMGALATITVTEYLESRLGSSR